MKTTPPPNFNDEKMAGFNLRADSSLVLGGGETNFSFYYVQDCSVSSVRQSSRRWLIYLHQLTKCPDGAGMTVMVQGWRSSESTRLPPMWPGFDS